MLTELYNVPNE